MVRGVHTATEQCSLYATLLLPREQWKSSVCTAHLKRHSPEEHMLSLALVQTLVRLDLFFSHLLAIQGREKFQKITQANSHTQYRAGLENQIVRVDGNPQR